MAQYRVDPAGVNAVTASVVKSAEPLGTAVEALGGHAASANTGSSSSIVGGALQDAFAVLGPQISAFQAKIPAVLSGTMEAGKAVMDGDEHMAEIIIGLSTGALSDIDAMRGMRGGPR